MVLERCTTATVGDFSGDLSQRTCVCRDQLDEVGLPVGAGFREQMLKMVLTVASAMPTTSAIAETPPTSLTAADQVRGHAAPENALTRNRPET
jgi:hypothetical protein